MIALYWVKGCAKRWKQFVANRVIEIQGRSSPSDWCHCPTADNPADLLTRGVPAESLVSNRKWWLGPGWLRESSNSWPEQLVKESLKGDCDEALKEQRGSPVTSLVVNMELVESLWNKFSEWTMLERVVAWCLRFIKNTRGERRLTPYLETAELKEAHDSIVKVVQRSEYSKEIASLEKGRVVKGSTLISLNPMLDHGGLLRVGGRLQHSNLPESAKHQLILPKSHRVSKLLIRLYHLKYFHGGIQLINAAMKQRYWIVGAKSAIRKIVKGCVTCARYRAETSKQIMGELPASRVNPGRAFLRCGTDFAGPFLVTPRRGRGVKALKMYVCVFVCFITKAVHLELVSDLSADMCIAALKRFVARRGKPTDIYSDCGTNFVGAKNCLDAWSLKSMGKFLEGEGVRWNLNVPSAPHFGGLWEAAVKSMKYHMRRVIGAQILSQEEFCTCLTQIEAVLNSRPLVAASEDPNDLTAITPGHFLIGSELRGLPEPDLLGEKVSLQRRLQLINQISQSFWKSWSKDYLTQLQVRSKWRVPEDNLSVNNVVLIKEDNLPPFKWKLARVISVLKGKDSRVRSVTLKTATGELKRPVHKLVKLPVDIVE